MKKGRTITTILTVLMAVMLLAACAAPAPAPVTSEEPAAAATQAPAATADPNAKVSIIIANGKGERYRSLGCAPCTLPIKSNASSPREIIEELRSGKFANIAERSGRDQDKEDGYGLETLRREGYM